MYEKSYQKDYVSLDLEGSDKNKIPGQKKEKEQEMKNIVKALVDSGSIQGIRIWKSRVWKSGIN